VTRHRNPARVQAPPVAAGSAAVVASSRSRRTVRNKLPPSGIDIGQIAKTLVCVADGEPVLAVLRGADGLDPSRLAAHLGAARVGRADADTVREATGYPVGG
jgi:prolyl-tRNA editing enzyme YbaK/EbsC (Cys-tRNA(Pro) deacylase)